MELFQCKELTKKFGLKTVLNDFSFSVKQNECLGIFGPNGAGKSTLINIICGVLKADKGEIIFNSKNIFDPKFRWLSSIGMVLEEESMFDYLSLRQHLLFCAELHKLSKSDAEKRIDELLEYLDLTDLSSTLVREASQGMKKKTAIASALIHHPDLLLLDEAFNGLDTVTMYRVKELLQRRTKTAVIITSHSLNDAEQFIDRAVLINSGKMVDNKSLQTILTENKSLESYYLKTISNSPVREELCTWL